MQSILIGCNLWGASDKVTTPKCDTCFSLGTWEGVVQKNYWQGH
jgi:hypothetical protein